MTDQPANQITADAIEHGLWQALANALQQLEDWGLMPLGQLADRLGVNFIQEVDAGPSIHGAGVRPRAATSCATRPRSRPTPTGPATTCPSVGR
ncbi:hypothetical protein ACFQ0M_17100 [Kitasatospora aburaviensis]